MVEIALQSMQMQTCVSILKLEQAVETRCYSEFSTIWSQFDAIGHKHSVTLFNHVKTIHQLKTFDHFQLESLIGKATAQKLRESVLKLPIVAPQIVDVHFVDQNSMTQQCKWEVKMLLQSSSTSRECRVNILAGLWHGAASLVKRHFLVESGPANCMTFMVTTKSREKNVIIHMAVLSCTHAGIDREIIYKCAINWADSNTPSLGRIEEINEKTLEVLGKKKSENEASKDFVEENEDTNQARDSQATQTKLKSKQKLPRDHSVMTLEETVKFSEKQLSLLPNKALKTVSEIKKKKTAEQRFELTDDEDELVFQEELFNQMDHPESTEQKWLLAEEREKSQQIGQRRAVESGKTQGNSAPVVNQGMPDLSNFQQISSFSHQESNSINYNHWPRRDQATRQGYQSTQNVQHESIYEDRNPFANFAYKPVQKELCLSKNPQALEKIPEFRTPVKASTQQAMLPRKITFDTESSFSALEPRMTHPRSEYARLEASWRTAGCEQTGFSIKDPKIHEAQVTAAPGNNVVQVIDMHRAVCSLPTELTPSLQLLSMYKTFRASKTVCNFLPISDTVESESKTLKSQVSNRAASIV
jgi:hypothetical protein